MAFDDVEARAQAIWPALQIERRLARSSKSDLFAATLDGEQVVLKALSSTQPLWRYYLAREIAAYDALQGEALPFAIPRCYGADLERGLLLLSACDGRRLANGRAASRPLPPAIVEHLVRGLRALARWSPRRGAALAQWPALSPALRAPLHSRGERARPLPDPGDTRGWLQACLVRWQRRGMLDARAVAALERWLARVPLDFAHGDLLLRNVLAARPRRAATAAAAASAATAAIATATAAAAPPVVAVTVLDWEFCGLYPRGWDLGLLWVGLRPDGRALLEQQLDAETRRDVDHATVLAAARELEVRRVSLRQAESHPLVQALVADLARARQRVD